MNAAFCRIVNFGTTWVVLCSLFVLGSDVYTLFLNDLHIRLPMEHHFTRQELYDCVWSKPMSHLVVELGTTTGNFSALLRRADIPTLPAGHWMRKEFGKPVEQPPLRQHQLDVLSRLCWIPRSQGLSATERCRHFPKYRFLVHGYTAGFVPLLRPQCNSH